MSDVYVVGKFLFLLSLAVLAGCSMDASIHTQSLLDNVIPEIENPIINRPQSREFDFLSGEVVTTHQGRAGYQIKAIFGETAEATQSKNANGWAVEGVFYY